MNEFVEQLIEKHNFVVRAVLTDYNFLEVNFAGKQKVSYILVEEDDPELIGESCIFRVISLLITTDDEQQELVYLPRYLSRLYIMCHIYVECRSMNLPYNTIKFFRELEDGTREKSELRDLITFDYSDSEREKEEKLNAAVGAIWQDFSKVNSFDIQMKSDGLFASLNILKGLLV